MQAQGQVQSQLQGINAYEQLLGGLNDTSQGYFAGPGGMASNALGQSNQYQQQGYNTASQNYRAQLGAASDALTGGKGGSGGSGGLLGSTSYDPITGAATKSTGLGGLGGFNPFS